MSGLMIYGAYGYSGRQIVESAVKRGLSPILAGRDPQRTAAVARELDLPHRSFALENPATIAEGLKGIKVVLHCAGGNRGRARTDTWLHFKEAKQTMRMMR